MVGKINRLQRVFFLGKEFNRVDFSLICVWEMGILLAMPIIYLSLVLVVMMTFLDE